MVVYKFKNQSYFLGWDTKKKNFQTPTLFNRECVSIPATTIDQKSIRQWKIATALQEVSSQYLKLKNETIRNIKEGSQRGVYKYCT